MWGRERKRKKQDGAGWFFLPITYRRVARIAIAAMHVSNIRYFYNFLNQFLSIIFIFDYISSSLFSLLNKHFNSRIVTHVLRIQISQLKVYTSVRSRNFSDVRFVRLPKKKNKTWLNKTTIKEKRKSGGGIGNKINADEEQRLIGLPEILDASLGQELAERYIRT